MEDTVPDLRSSPRRNSTALKPIGVGKKSLKRLVNWVSTWAVSSKTRWICRKISMANNNDSVFAVDTLSNQDNTHKSTDYDWASIWTFTPKMAESNRRVDPIWMLWFIFEVSKDRDSIDSIDSRGSCSSPELVDLGKSSYRVLILGAAKVNCFWLEQPLLFLGWQDCHHITVPLWQLQHRLQRHGGWDVPWGIPG